MLPSASLNFANKSMNCICCKLKKKKKNYVSTDVTQIPKQSVQNKIKNSIVGVD